MNVSQKTYPITGLILAGGQSRRFGSDKALHHFQGQTLLDRNVTLLQSVVHPVMISVANESQTYDTSATCVVDHFKNVGPLGGLHAGLMATKSPWMFVTAVDLPCITRLAITSIIDTLSDDLDAVVATDGNHIQPLFGCYRTTLRVRLADNIQQKKLSATQFVQSIRHAIVPVAPTSLINVNELKDVP